MGKTESKIRSNDNSPTLFTSRDCSPGVAPMSAVSPCTSPILRRDNREPLKLKNSGESRIIFDQNTKNIEYKALCLPFSKLWLNLNDNIKQKTTKRMVDESNHHFLLNVTISMANHRIMICYSGRITLMNVYTGISEANIDHPFENRMSNIVETPEKHLLFSTDSQRLRVWDLNLENTTITLQKEIRSSKYPELSNMKSLNGSYVAGSSGASIHVFNVEDVLKSSEDTCFYTCHYSTYSDQVYFQSFANGTKIIANYPGDAIKIWDWTTEKCVKTFDTQRFRRCQGSIPNGHFMKDIQIVQDRYIPIFGSNSMAVWLDLETEEIIRRKNTEMPLTAM
jgi:hypothetical protein